MTPNNVKMKEFEFFSDGQRHYHKLRSVVKEKIVESYFKARVI